MNLLAIQETWVPPWAGKILCRREWQSTRGLLPGEPHGQRSLVGYSLGSWGVRDDWVTKHIARRGLKALGLFNLNSYTSSDKIGVKQISSPCLMCETGCSGPVHWDNPDRWDGEGGRRGLQDGEHKYTHGWFMSMYGKNHYNIVK